MAPMVGVQSDVLDCLKHRFQHVIHVVRVDEGHVIGNTFAVAVAVNAVVGSVRAIRRIIKF